MKYNLLPNLVVLVLLLFVSVCSTQIVLLCMAFLQLQLLRVYMWSLKANCFLLKDNIVS